MLKFIRKVINFVIAVAVVALFAVFLLPRIFGYQPYMVVSASMQQSFPVGSVIFVKGASPEEIEVGDPITFSSGTLVITHRVVAIDEENRVFTTKGDNNTASEKVSFDNLKGKALNFAVPGLGYFAAWFTTLNGRIISAVIIICLAMLSTVLGKIDELDGKKEDNDGTVI